MKKYLWILAVAGVLLLGSGVLVWNAKTAPPEPRIFPLSSLPAPVPMPVQTKTKTRNVYDGSTKVGELTFTIQKSTTAPSGPNWITISSTMVFEVTNTDYMTDASPMPTTEIIPLANGDDTASSLNEKSGILVGHVDLEMDACFQLMGRFTDSSWTWNDFFTDPLDQTHMKLGVCYWNTDYHVTQPYKYLALEAKEETE